MASRFLSLLVLLTALFSASCTSTPHVAQRIVITDRGAISDGATVNTKAIQAAIDACAASGGGVIVVPKGTFLSGALYFKTGVSLEIEKDAVLKSTNVKEDFLPLYTSWEGIERYWTAGFLNFIGVSDVTLSGEGTIDGSGLSWGSATAPRSGGGGNTPRLTPAPESAPTAPAPKVPDFYQGPVPTTKAVSFAPDPAHLPPINAAGIALPGAGGRISPPRAVVFQECQNVRVSGLRLKNPARWGFVFIYCRGVIAENLNVRTESYIPSSDGIDVCSCEDVSISHCDIACNDDCISIKAGKDEDGLRVNRPSQNITISDCVFGSGGGVDLGSEVSGGIRHVIVQRCKFVGSGTAARMKSQPSRGGVIEDVLFQDIEVTNVDRVIGFEMEWRMVPPIAPAAKTLTVARNIRLVNFTGTGKSAGVILGLKGSPIRNVTIQNSQLTTQRGLVLANAEDIDLAGLTLQVKEGEPIVRQAGVTTK